MNSQWMCNKKRSAQFIGCAVFCFALFVLLAIHDLQTAVRYTGSKYSQQNSTLLSAAPGKSTADDDAAVRWNYRFRGARALRVEREKKLRSSVPLHNREILRINEDSCKLFANCKFLCSRESVEVYFQKLWKKILPPRAGPCA